MGLRDNLPETASSYLYFGSVGVLILIAVVVANNEWGATGVQSANIAISGYLTAALVWLYKQQADILGSQHDLLAEELRWEAREKHTEALREVVQIWHGNTERDTTGKYREAERLNLPSVEKASFNSAPTEESVFAEEEPFRVIPYQLEGDRYLEDLLENHATDLEGLREDIQDHHDQFVSTREEFLTAYSLPSSSRYERFYIHPTSDFKRYLFDLLVMYARGRWGSEEELREYIQEETWRGTSVNWGSGMFRTVVNIPSLGNNIGIFIACWDPESTDGTGATNKHAVENAKQLTLEVLSEIDLEEYPFSLASSAATTLEDADAEISKLEKLLIEYHGMPIYTGDCEYITTPIDSD